MKARCNKNVFLARSGLVAAGLLATGLAHAGHPLVSDDTGTQGTGNWQFEANTDYTSVKEEGIKSRSWAVNAALAYGLIEPLDISINVPLQRDKTDGESAQKGIGDVSLVAKWRFYENDNGWSVALKPEVTLPTGKESKGLGAGRATAALSLLGQYEQAGWIWLVNAGLTYNDNKVDERKSLWSASTALLYSPNEQWTFAVDTGLSRNPDKGSSKKPAYAVLGAIYHVNKDLDLDIGYQRSLQSGPTEHTVGVGLTMRW
ncbi:MAG: transporter [Burkholderiaceae bacterium]|jgi:hypothetical protein|nr:transporter [Burkholderiaceae bacterium]